MESIGYETLDEAIRAAAQYSDLEQVTTWVYWKTHNLEWFFTTNRDNSGDHDQIDLSFSQARNNYETKIDPGFKVYHWHEKTPWKETFEIWNF